MRTFILTIFFVLAYYACFRMGYKSAELDLKKIQKERVFILFGEGDLGEQVNYYLQTGDTSVQNYQ